MSDSCWGEDGGGGHWLVPMEWRSAGWSVYLRLLIFPCTTKCRSSLLAPAHPGGPGKRTIKQLCVCVQSEVFRTSKNHQAIDVVEQSTLK